ncbi:hypothetical protein EQV77_14770 [Halobacillus fulvus]|nr:hypothetical protein EQV77_14770 [Halobacillus fulvus]
MKKKKKFENSEWKMSIMALFIFIGGSIGSQIVYYPDLPNLPSILGYLTGALVMVAGNVVYVIYKRKKRNGAGNEN